MSTLSRLSLLLFSLTVFIATTRTKEVRIVCYYTNWSVYRPGTAKFSPQNINPYLCTHLVYAFGGFTKENTLKPFDKYQDIEKGGYAKFTGLKTYNKNLKTLLAIGGWNEGSSRFSPMVANPERRKELVKNVIKFLRQNHFDGLDLDWEYPSFRDGGKPRDKENYALLVQELREEFERESEKTGRTRLLLTMAVPAGIEYINKGYDVPKLTKYLDWMNILSYDYHSAFEPAVNHHAPLYPLEEVSEYNYDGELNIDYTIKHYLEKGADPSKLVLGIPTYGRSYTLYNPEANEIGAPADGPGDMGEATRENGYLAYYEICDYVKNNGWKVENPNSDAMGPYAYKDNQWVSYDDEDIVRKKSEYVAEKELGGIMFWSIDNDDFRGNCHGKPYPLIEAGKEALLAALGVTEDNAISEQPKPIKAKTRQRNKSSTPVKETTTERNRNSSGAQAIRTRSRLKIKKQEEQSETRNKVTIKKDKLQTRRKQTTTTRRPEASTGSSLVVTPGYSTPPPPTTPDPGSDFKCEDEGFFPHPRDCKKYFWCLSSGPSDLGIVAHQFTCPSGLYFNKAADSCDYTQNVLCRKKTTTTTTTAATTTATTTTTARSAFSTPKPLPKITAATSRTTFSTTTASPEEEYEEYEYEDEEESVTDDKKGISEEDPKVIKELLDLIKRAGGIEELEKQLKIHEDGTASISGSGSTTQSSISKSLYERVLSRGAARFKDNKQTKPSYTTLNRNSRGPQADGLDKSEESSSKSSRERLQYTSIARQRATTAKAIVDDVEEEVEESVEDTSSQRSLRKPSNQPEYVTIRRQRPTTTTEAEILTRNIAEVNSKLGEISTQAPEYVTIRRQRPSTEKSSTSKYVTISRGTTTVSQATEDEAEETTLQTTNSQTTSTESTTNTNDIKFSTKTSVTETSSSSNSNVPNLISSSSTDTTDKTVKANEAQTESSKVTPHLFDPRPFSFTARKKPTTTSSEITTTPIPKVSETTTTKTRLRQNPSPVNKLSTETSPEELDKLSQRSQSRFKHRNRIRSYSATDIKEDQNQSTQLPPQRVRNPNRLHFTPPTTEPYQDTYTQVRLFRPDVAAEISDLSSLTAVDFNAVRKNLPSTSRPIARRGRPRTSTTTQASVESNQNRTNSIPQSNRRAFRVRQNATAVFERPQVNGTSESAFRVRKVHRLQIESTTARAINFSEETRTLNRGRKIIRRLKPLSQRTSTTTTTTLAPTTIFETAEDSTKDNLIYATEAESNEREDILKSNEEGENIKLSESNIKENSDTSGIRNSNVLASEEKYQNSDELSKGASTPEDNVGSSSFETKSSTEPNIIVRTRKIIRKFQRPTVPQTTSTQPTSSESSTESSLSFSTESEFKKSFGRTRKVVRRFRPTSTFKPTSAEAEISSKEGVIQSNLRNKKPYFVRRKPTFTTEVANKTEFAPPKRVSYPTQLRRRLPGSLTSSTSQATEATPVSSVASESSFSEEAPNTTASEATTQKLEVAFGLKVSEEATTVEDDVSATTIEITASSAVTESTSASTTATTVQTSSTRSRGKYSPNRLNKFNTAAPRRRFTLRSSSTTTTVATTKLEPSTEKVVETTVAEEEQTVITSERDSETTTQLSNDEITTIPSIGDKNADDFPTSYATTPIEETSESFTDTLETNFSSSEISTTTEAPEDITTVQVTTLTTEEPDVKTTEHISSTSTTSATTTTEGGFITRRPHRIFAPAKSRPKFAPHLPTTEVSTSTTERVPAYKVSKNIFSTRKPYVPKASQTPSLIDILTKSSTEAPRKHFVPHKQKDEDFEELPADEPVVDEDDVEVEEDDDEVKVNNRENSQKSKVAGKDKTVIVDSQENRHLRNQKLYSHPRKMNIPHPGPVTPSPSTTEALDSQITTGTPEIPTETTESSLTTLHHVFAITESLEAENSSEATTLATNKTSQKIVEISRIVEVSAKEEKVNPNKNDVVESKTTLEVVPVQNKLGEITRVTEIKVVDGSNKTTSENEITDEKAERKVRKFQLYGGIKIDNEISNKYKQNTIEIIDSKSHVKKITPKPAFPVEATTLPLEALFTRATDHEELLNTQNSNFVKVRLLEQDVFVDGMSLDDDAGFVPLRILPQDDYALKAKVVEVPKKEQMIKIAPIALQNVAFKRDATGDGEVTTVVYAEGIEPKSS